MRLHKYVDVAAVKASNDASEVLRRLEQQLREFYGTYIDQQETALHQERHATEARATELEAAPALIGEIDTGLHYYEQLKQRASTLVAAHLLDSANSAQAPSEGDPIN
jgi:translation initiation factor 2 alpha subunit (eIF-2alpha)